MKIKKSRINFTALLIAVLLFVVLQPYFIWHISPMLKLFLLASPSLLLVNKIEYRYFFIFFLILLFGVLVQRLSVIYSIYLLSFVFVPFTKKTFAATIYRYFKTIIASIFLFSLIQWLLFWIGIGFPSIFLEPLTEMKQYDYTAYLPFLVVPNLLIESFRFLSVFDEPGVVGTISLLLLYIEGYQLKNFENLIILIAGICSFSFFFILGSLLFLFVKLIFRRPVILFIIIPLMLSFYTLTKDNEVLYDLVYSRMEWDKSSGSFSGDNRATDNFKQYYNSIKGTSGYYFGVGEKALAYHNDGGYGYRNVVLRYGFIFCALYVIFFLFYAKKNNLSRQNFCFFAIMFLATLYQRPNMLDAAYLFLFTQYINNHSPYNKRIYA